MESKANDFLLELSNRQHYHPNGQPPYSCEMIRFALLLRYTSGQAYKILLDKLPLPSMSILRRLKSGSIDAIKAAKVLKENNSISEDIILMADELYLQKSAQYSGGQYVGTDEKGNLYKGVVVFMIHGLKSSVPIVVKAVPEVTVNGQWLAEEISNCISNLADAGFRVRGIVTDNHSANVAAFNNLLQMYSCDTDLCIQHPKNSTKTYMLLVDSSKFEDQVWLENWSQCSPSIFNLSKQTSNALIKTLRAQALLVEELLQEDFEYVIMSKLQSDPVERRFSQYRQLSGGNFLV